MQLPDRMIGERDILVIGRDLSVRSKQLMANEATLGLVGGQLASGQLVCGGQMSWILLINTSMSKKIELR